MKRVLLTILATASIVATGLCQAQAPANETVFLKIETPPAVTAQSVESTQNVYIGSLHYKLMAGEKSAKLARLNMADLKNLAIRYNDSKCPIVWKGTGSDNMAVYSISGITIRLHNETKPNGQVKVTCSQATIMTVRH